MAMDDDTTTLATDEECAELELKARSRGYMHWPELVRVFNRLHYAERQIADLEAESSNLAHRLSEIEEARLYPVKVTDALRIDEEAAP